MIMVMRYCPGYRIEHLMKLSIKQFNRMVKEVYALQAYEQKELASIIRMQNAEPDDFNKMIDNLDKAVRANRGKPERSNKPAVRDTSEKELDELFNKG